MVDFFSGVQPTLIPRALTDMNTRLPTILGASLFLAVPAIAQVVVATDTFELIDHLTGDRTFVTGGINGIKFYTRNAAPRISL